jgi:hypothetical protein
MEERLTNTVPNWKFWHPLAFWKVIAIFLVVDLLMMFSVVAVRELAGLAVPEWVGYGLGSGLAVTAVSLLVRRARLKSAQTPSA